MILIFEEDSEKKSESQMGFEPTTLRDLVGSRALNNINRNAPFFNTHRLEAEVKFS